jgi:NAD(P)-dependent dehydrogenase (short-subunit alcohol dehydrogenase family)
MRSPASVLTTPGCAVIQGASRGIGAALAQALLAQDEVTRVIATSRSPHQSPQLTRLAETHPQRCALVAMDVEAESAIEAGTRAIAQFVPPGDQLRLVINCAGLLHDADLKPEKRLEDLRQDHLMRLFAVNAIAPMLVARYLQPLMARKGRSVFASVSARVGSISDNRLGGWYGYRASKAAQNMFTRTLSIELARRLPDCICVGLHPGTVETDLSAPFRGNLPAGQTVTPEVAAVHLLDVLASLTPGDSGGCFAWDGQRIAP